MNLQAIIFDKHIYSAASARTWLKRRGFVPIKRVHKTANYLRYRLVEPNPAYKYKMITLADGVKAVAFSVR